MKLCTIGVDIGTSSSKAVLVDVSDGSIVATAKTYHQVCRPRPNWVEMDPELWWLEFVSLTRELLVHRADVLVVGVGVSGMGPCVALADENDHSVRPAILYGVDSRAVNLGERMTEQLGEEAIREVGGSLLSSQSAGPKIRWVAENEPGIYARARRVYMPASWLVRRLTGAYVLDHQSASQMSPLYNIRDQNWHDPWWDEFASGLERPQIHWASEIAGEVTREASEVTGLPVGTPVTVGTIDAWAESVSVGAFNSGDLMLMYGTTMFLVWSGNEIVSSPSMWTTAGVYRGSVNLAGGLSTSGALTEWIKDLTRLEYDELIQLAEKSGKGARGLLMLPYFSGERTPILDPLARGVVTGLALHHTAGDLYRAALEATGFGVHHNIETMRDAGCEIERVVAVGGGTQARLWLQTVSNITGLEQQVPSVTIGASFGSAFLSAAAIEVDEKEPCISDWNPVSDSIYVEQDSRDLYLSLFDKYIDLYDRTREINHSLSSK